MAGYIKGMTRAATFPNPNNHTNTRAHTHTCTVQTFKTMSDFLLKPILLQWGRVFVVIVYFQIPVQMSHVTPVQTLDF